jgi:hypothetical protein
MSINPFWLMDAQIGRHRPFFPKGHGKPRSMAGACRAE